MSTTSTPNINGPLIEGLRQISLDIIDEGNFRVGVLNARKKEFRKAEKTGKKLSEEEERRVSIITPTPDIDPQGGYFDWFYHILHREEDLKEQLKYLYHLADDVRARIKDIENAGDRIMYSEEAQRRMRKFYIESAKEMQVDINDELQKNWFPEEWEKMEEMRAEMSQSHK